ncbi:MAG TPA: hypothetical protein VK400_20165 [Pyrinomonadaceae bacterium]|nr:hypothetical protein [Pyrinomonadaceae bacterium]
MKNQSKQCLCQAKGVTFISSYAYCEKCGKQIEPETSGALVETARVGGAQGTSEIKEVLQKRRAGYGIY